MYEKLGINKSSYYYANYNGTLVGLSDNVTGILDFAYNYTATPYMTSALSALDYDDDWTISFWIRPYNTGGDERVMSQNGCLFFH